MRALLTRTREFDDLTGSEHVHLERAARRYANQRISDLLDVVLRHNGDALDRENDVAAYSDLPSADGHDSVAPLEAHVPRLRIFGDRLDEEPGRCRHVEDSHEVAAEHDALESTPEHLPIDQELLRSVDRHDKAQALAAAR